jgi:hypothetical protein
MTDAELIALAIQMRAAQKHYYKTKQSQHLFASKEIEARFDKAVRVRAAVLEAPADLPWNDPDEAQEWHDYDPDC